jgi:transglutaminase-like putative cysteine protease
MAQAVTIGLPPEYVSYRDGSIALAADEITAGAARDKASLAATLYEFARDQVAYIDHPWQMQVVQDARRTLQLRTGDCVSKSVLLSTLLASLGIGSRFVAQASTVLGGFDHVYVEAFLQDGVWLALDPTADGKDGRPAGAVGWTQRLEDGGFEMKYEIF